MSQDYEAPARAITSGMLGMKLWVITTKAVVDRGRIAPLLQAHLEHQVRLEKEEVMFGAGPLHNPNGSRGSHATVRFGGRVDETGRLAVAIDPKPPCSMGTL